MNLTAHFTLEELTRSSKAIDLGIDNSPPPAARLELIHTAELLEQVRSLLGDRPLSINSGFRCKALNEALPGASPTSAHMWGGAADFTCAAFGTPLEICRELARCAETLRFDQIIEEGTWVHIGRAPLSTAPRLEVLTAMPGGGYRRGLG